MVHIRVQRQRQYCVRCNQLMFEYFVSPDGHFGLVSEPGGEQARRKPKYHARRAGQCTSCSIRSTPLVSRW